jgi:hypothetical protein
LGSPFSPILPRECVIIQQPLQAENHVKSGLNEQDNPLQKREAEGALRYPLEDASFA